MLSLSQLYSPPPLPFRYPSHQHNDRLSCIYAGGRPAFTKLRPIYEPAPSQIKTVPPREDKYHHPCSNVKQTRESAIITSSNSEGTHHADEYSSVSSRLRPDERHRRTVFASVVCGSRFCEVSPGGRCHNAGFDGRGRLPLSALVAGEGV